MRQWLYQSEPAYQWTLSKIEQEEKYERYLIKMCSQSWRSDFEVKEPIWRHDLKIIVPKKRTIRSALLFIHGGDLDKPSLCESSFAHSLEWAMLHGIVVVEISLVPNQHIEFLDEFDQRYIKEGRREDQIIAYTWKKFLETQDPTWPLQMPMTKSVIKGLDCIQEFAQKKLNLTIEKFMISGVSKRGWVSWLVAAYDPRIQAVCPMVIDMLNLRASFAHHYDIYGQWAQAIEDYSDVNIQDWIYRDEFSKLLELVEPFQLRHNLKMPKYVVNASGDEFFLPDSSQFYFEELSEPKYLRYIPNCSHNLYKSRDAFKSVGAFFTHIASGGQLPSFTWSHQKPDKVKVEFQDKPTSMKLWSAYNPTARDFRLQTIQEAWTAELLQRKGQTTTVELMTPQKGWQASFIEFTYLNEQNLEMIFTTDVYITTLEKGV